GRRLASGSDDHTIRFWFASFPEAMVSPRTRADAVDKIYRASLHILHYEPPELDFEPVPDPTDLSPLNGYHFPKRREVPATDLPRPLDKDLLEWLLEVGEKLPKTEQ